MILHESQRPYLHIRHEPLNRFASVFVAARYEVGLFVFPYMAQKALKFSSASEKFLKRKVVKPTDSFRYK